MKKRKRSATANSFSVDGSILYVSKPKKLCTSKLNDKVLNPYGALFIRLDTTKFHLVDKAKGGARYSMHIWLRFETQRVITYCETCNVNLCKSCFEYCHVTPDIASEKKSLARKFKKEHDRIVNNRERCQKNR